MIEKKMGMSSIVATSLVITITILAGAILGSFIVPFVQKNLERSTECSDFETYFSLETEVLKPICYQTVSNDNYIVIGASNDKALEPKVNGFNLLLLQVSNPSNPAGKAVSINVVRSGSTDSKLTLLGAENARIPAVAPKAGEILTYVYNDGQKYERAEIAVIVGNGRVCEKKSDVVKIVPCGNQR